MINRSPRRTDHAALPLEGWPEADRVAWQDANCAQDFLETGGHGATWRPESRRSAWASYSRWLAWLVTQGNVLEDEAPAERITPGRMTSYVAFLQQGRASVTVAAYLGVLYMAVRAMFPDHDWAWLLALQARLKRRAKPSRGKELRIVPADQLLQLGLDLLARAGAVLERHKAPGIATRVLIAAARDFRDGLIIALLSSRPLRVKNLLAIEINRHLRQTDTCTTLKFEAAEMKDRRPFVTTWPAQLLSALATYVTVARPLLIGAHAPGDDPARKPRLLGAHLWAAQGGTPLTPGGLHKALRRHTQPRFGHAISPHCFRDCVASTLANNDPNYVRHAAMLLGHGSLRTTERSYILPNSEVALARHHDLISSIRKAARSRTQARRNLAKQ